MRRRGATKCVSVQGFDVEFSKDCRWDEHIYKVTGTGQAQVGKLYVILLNRHLDTRITYFNQTLVIAGLAYTGELWEGKLKIAKVVPGVLAAYQQCSNAASSKGRIWHIFPENGETQES